MSGGLNLGNVLPLAGTALGAYFGSGTSLGSGGGAILGGTGGSLLGDITGNPVGGSGSGSTAALPSQLPTLTGGQTGTIGAPPWAHMNPQILGATPGMANYLPAGGNYNQMSQLGALPYYSGIKGANSGNNSSLLNASRAATGGGAGGLGGTIGTGRGGTNGGMGGGMGGYGSVGQMTGGYTPNGYFPASGNIGGYSISGNPGNTLGEILGSIGGGLVGGAPGAMAGNYFGSLASAPPGGWSTASIPGMNINFAQPINASPTTIPPPWSYKPV